MVKVQNSDSYGLKRLESKNARNAIIQKLAVDFNLTSLTVWVVENVVMLPTEY